MVVEPSFISAEYEYREDGTFGTLVSWGIEEVNPWLNWFVVERYVDPNGSPEEEWYVEPTELELFDEVAPGTYCYRLYAVYFNGGGVPTNTGYAPNLNDPSLDYAMVEVTSTEEFFDAKTAFVQVYNAAGQQVYSGKYDAFDQNALRDGVYVLRLTANDGTVLNKKIIKR